jgi:transketolase
MRDQGKSVSFASLHTVKPLDEEKIIDAMKRHKQIIFIEETAPNGSIGRRIKELAWEASASCRIDTFCLQDEFIHNYGDHRELLAAHGLELDKIFAKVM